MKRLTGGNDLCKALAGGQEDEELAEVGEEAQVQKEEQKEIKERANVQLEACTHPSHMHSDNRGT